MKKEKHIIAKEKIHREENEFFEEGKISEQENEFADYSHKCPKCSFDKAEVVDLGPSYSDEDNVVLLRCGKCGWSERSTKKSG